MSYERFDIRQLGVKEEATYGTTPGGNWVNIRAWGDAPIPAQAMHEGRQYRQALYRNKMLPGSAAGDNLTFQTYFQSEGASGTARNSLLLEHALGGHSNKRSAASTVAAAASATQFTVATGSLAVLEGDHIGVVIGSYVEVVEVVGFAVGATDTIDVWPALSTTPTPGSVVYGCHTFYETGTPADSFSVLVQGENADDIRTFTGAVGSCSFVFDPSDGAGPHPIINWSFKYQDCGLTGVSAPAYWADDAIEPLQLEGAIFIANGYTAGARDTAWSTSTVFSKFEFDLGWNLQAIRSATGTNAVIGYKATVSDSLFSGKVTIPWAASLRTAMLAGTQKCFFLRLGRTTTGGVVGLNIPNVVFTNVQQINQDGQIWAEVSFHALEHTDTDATPPTALDGANVKVFMF